MEHFTRPFDPPPAHGCFRDTAVWTTTPPSLNCNLFPGQSEIGIIIRPWSTSLLDAARDQPSLVTWHQFYRSQGRGRAAVSRCLTAIDLDIFHPKAIGSVMLAFRKSFPLLDVRPSRARVRTTFILGADIISERKGGGAKGGQRAD